MLYREPGGAKGMRITAKTEWGSPRVLVTDKLRVTDPGSPYGCCVLALTGHQTNLPDYCPGGDRLRCTPRATRVERGDSG